MTTDRVMLLIDADNVSVDVMEQAVELLLEEYGALHVRRAYCTAESALKHQQLFKRLSIKPMVNLAAGKNSTDIALAVDAVDLVLSERPEVVVIASSDSDFAPLVSRLREKGCKVRGIGQQGKTGDETLSVYDDYTVLEHRKRGGTPRKASRPPARGGDSRRGGRSREAGRDPGRESAHEPIREPMREPAREASRDSARETVRETVRESARERAREPARERDREREIDLPRAEPTPPQAVPEAVTPPPKPAGKAASKTATKAPARKSSRRKVAEAVVDILLDVGEPIAVAPEPAPARAPAPVAPPPAPRPPPPAPLPDEVVSILAALPELARGGTVELRLAAERLRDADLLGPRGSSTRFFAPYAEYFELVPEQGPNKVRRRVPGG